MALIGREGLKGGGVQRKEARKEGRELGRVKGAYIAGEVIFDSFTEKGKKTALFGSAT